ncbi:hypothetical protein NDU88_011441 [Pleurodeles waltl]|uniref:Uncharacterized protein n=1 Tax=Pleurodeles waltl TaxID=8319 RepID=A0AAV7QZ53_PLEWA|nr:hypothetical protein NDU88_011441 [Pleurodeles waltl]
MTRDHVPTNPKWPLRQNDVLVRGSTSSSTHPPSEDDLRLQRECCPAPDSPEWRKRLSSGAAWVLTAPDSPEWRLFTMRHTRRATTR